MTEGYRKSVLPNGIRILTERMPHVRSVAVGVWVETGSRHESPARGGVSHLIEHLVFKGTATRTAQDIARTMDSVGGQMDAFTTKENTCFYVQVLVEDLDVEAGVLFGGEGIHLPTDRVHRAGDRLGAARGRALEHEVLDEMGHPTSVLGLVA